MTAPPDAPPAPAADPGWDERPIVGNTRGLPWWAAVLLAFGLTALAALIDVQRLGSLGRIYQGTYILGCLVAVCAVRRRNLFGPMVQPPLVFAVTAIGAVVLSQPGPLFGQGVKQLVFSVALPLTSNFPTMAITTGVTVAIGLARLWFQRNPDPRTRANRRGERGEPPAAAPRTRREPREPARSPRPERRADRARAEDPPPGARRRTPREQPPPPRRTRSDPPPRERTRTTPPPEQRRRQPPQPPKPRRDQPRRRPPDDYR